MRTSAFSLSQLQYEPVWVHPVSEVAKSTLSSWGILEVLEGERRVVTGEGESMSCLVRI